MSHNTIPFINLKEQYRSIQNEINPVILNLLQSGLYAQGKEVEEFEHQFADYLGVKHVLCVNSGTSALHLSMIVLGIGRGDEVIVPALTFIATAWAVSYVGAKPVFVDCDPKTWQIDPAEIEKKITAKTKAIIGVHLFGQPFAIEEIKKIAKKHNLYLVEDCAQAHGALYKRKKVGTFGDLACFSFYPTKNLGAYGEGGAIAFSSRRLAKRISRLRNQGSDKKYYHEEIGFNMRMENIQGAVLKIKLKHLEKWNQRRREIAGRYFLAIKNPKIIMQHQPSWAESVFHQFVVVSKERDKLQSRLTSKGIGTSVCYPVPCHLQKAYHSLGYIRGSLPCAEYFTRHCISLPVYPELNSRQIQTIIDVINQDI